MKQVDKYNPVSRLFHWLVAVLVIGMIAAGIYMADLPVSMEKIRIYNIHKSTGFCILVLTVLRLMWRARNPVPPLPATMKDWERTAAQVSHFGLYGFLLAMPVVGLLHSWAANFPVVIFGLFRVPPLIPPHEHLKEIFSWMHWLGGMAFAGLVVLHILAALKHHFVNRDDVPRRMI